MCGICGFVGYRDDAAEVLEQMMLAIRHRGPDDQGMYCDNTVSLGFQRLAIVDVQGGQQPIRNETEDLVFLCNGEIYNYDYLRKQLERLGHRFRTGSDTEVILHGYEEHGIQFLNYVRGMFAFVIWDRIRERLIAARDFFGIKPLYYSLIENSFVFASEIKSILQFPDYQKKLNEDALEQYLSFQYSVLEETFFSGIYQLLPGQYIQYSRGEFYQGKYYFARLLPGDFPVHGREKQFELKVAVDRSIQRHLTGEMEIGGFLSEGIDSNYIAATARCKKMFTVGYESLYSQYSEIDHSKALRKTVSFEHFNKIITKEEFWASLGQVNYYMDEPCGDASAVALYLLSEEAAKQVKVVLSGEGADELFGGYEIYKEPEALKWMKWIPAGIRSVMAKMAAVLPDIKGRDYIIRAGTPLEKRYIGNACIFNTRERRDILKTCRYTKSTSEFLRDQYKKAASLSETGRMQQIDINNWLPGDILRKADRMSMAHSLEIRVPYLDYDVFQTASRMFDSEKINGGKTKVLFRRIVGERLPPEISERKKRGFPVPIRIWIKEEPWRSNIEKAFGSPVAQHYFHEEKLLKLLEEHAKGKRDNSRKIWTVYMFLVWCNVYGIE